MIRVTSLKKYETPEVSVVMIDQDIITASQGGYGGGDGDLFDDERSSPISHMNPLNRPLGIFKRD